jgi:hypothetical protein
MPLGTCTAVKYRLLLSTFLLSLLSFFMPPLEGQEGHRPSCPCCSGSTETISWSHNALSMGEPHSGPESLCALKASPRLVLTLLSSWWIYLLFLMSSALLYPILGDSKGLFAFPDSPLGLILTNSPSQPLKSETPHVQPRRLGWGDMKGCRPFPVPHIALHILIFSLCRGEVPSGHRAGTRAHTRLLWLPGRKSFFITVGILIELSKVHETSYINGKLSISHRPICSETVSTSHIFLQDRK